MVCGANNDAVRERLFARSGEKARCFDYLRSWKRTQFKREKKN
jgi:hypothetical protein